MLVVFYSAHKGHHKKVKGKKCEKVLSRFKLQTQIQADITVVN
uniref:Uncharacterized protein n=1 Tax=Aliarcobacter butzleri TaxID=28197 RepID=A0A220SV17_9BACT|nr:Hypothetical protein [Aliarcobacter butzleri]